MDKETGRSVIREGSPYEESLIYRTVDEESVKRYIDILNSKDKKMFESIGTLYADRMSQWDHEKYEKCSNSAFGKLKTRFLGVKAIDLEKFISEYLGKRIRLIAAYTNKGYDGYDYFRFDYILI